MRILVFAALLFLVPRLTLGQSGGENVYDFLNMTHSARLAALGGAQVGLADNDLNLFFNNSAALTDSVSNHLVLNVAPYVADITSGAVGYARHFKGVGTFALGIHYVNYGTFNRTDESGADLGTFKASDYALMLAYSRPFGPRWRGALTLKPVVSNLENYKSFGLAIDGGVIYHSLDGSFSGGLAFRNVGTQITTYHDDDQINNLQADLQAGISFKPQHAPFRFSLTMHNLLDWEGNTLSSTGSNGTYELKDNMGFGEKLLRHTILGVEFLPFRNFYLATGYNHARRQDLKGQAKAGSSGFSWGMGFRVYKFHFAYGSARYHIGGRTNYFSISTNLGAF